MNHLTLEHIKHYRQILCAYIKIHRLAISLVALIFLLNYLVWFGAPHTFPTGKTITIEEGSTLSQIAEQLEEENVVKSSVSIKLLAMIFGGTSGVLAGDYVFNNDFNAVVIASRITSGTFGLTPVWITLPEGATSYQYAEILSGTLSRVNEDYFSRISERHEGYLYPNTYLFLPNSDSEVVLDTLLNTFDEEILSLEEEINAFDRPLEDIIIMASLLEREGNTLESKRMIAGILWSRLEIGMPLQVDAVFGYIARRETFHPSFADLEVDSPYNTYRNIGLPPGPIANPGKNAILAAVTPIESEYLYYLTGRDGNMRYAETFEGHVQNRRLYLD